MIFVGRHGFVYNLAAVACVAVVVVLPSFECLPTTNNQEASTLQATKDRENGPAIADLQDELLMTAPDDSQLTDLAVKDTSLVDFTKGHNIKPMKMKKKKPMGKHKKKKQTFKDKLLPLLLIPFVIQTMLIPLFITNLKMLALKAMTIGKFAILLIIFNMYKSWSQNAHSYSVHGNSMSAAQNYGFNGGPEFGALFNGR